MLFSWLSRARSTLALTVAVPALVSVGCQERSEPSASITVSDSAGVPVVTSSGEGIDRESEWALTPQPHLRIGTIGGGEETQFTSVRDAVRLSDGRLLIAESGNRRVRLFSSDGQFLNWIGGVGDGPTEYRSVGRVGILAGDTVWVHDSGRRKFVLFTPDGQFVRTFRPQRTPESPFFRRSGMLQNGRVWDEGSTLNLSSVPAGMEEFQEEVVVSVMDREGRAPVVVARAPGLAYTFSPTRGEERRLLTTGFDNLFGSNPGFAFSRDRFYRADPGPFEIREISLDGALLKITRIERSPIPLTRPMIEAYETLVLESTAPQAQPALRQRLRQFTYADSLPHFQGLKVDDEGQLWVGEFVDHRRGRVSRIEPSRWWRIGPEGGVAGYLDVPDGFRLLTIAADEVLGVERDQLDVPYLVAYRVIRGS